MRNKCFLTFGFMLLTLIALPQDVKIKDLNGQWKLRKAGSKEWIPAKVPGAVHLDLLRNRSIDEPFFRDNEARMQWIGETGWEYKKEFILEESAFVSRHIELVFNGLDTYANIYVNDSLVMVADNMFREWSRDIKKFLVSGNNVIRVQFPSVLTENKERYHHLNYQLPGDDKVVCRKAAYHFGWDWGPTLITSGIWKPVYLRSWTHINVLNVQFFQKHLTDSIAKMTAEFGLISELADSAYFTITSKEGLMFRKAAILKKGVNYIRMNFEIPYPKRWWPNGLGEPFLYEFSYEVKFAGRIVGEGKKHIGLRTISLVEEPDPYGRSFYFKINDIPVFIKGANYIPQDNFLTRVSDSSYQKLIRDVKSANINMLRVWGGGIYEKDIFYNLCDENGILVWQDFMFACAMYPKEKEFMRNVLAEVVENVYRLRNHPCIALWCGNNEIEEGWYNWGWQKQYQYSSEDSASIFNAYQFLFRLKIPELIGKYDSLRPYISSSPRSGWGHPESFLSGDVHYWGVWWGNEPFSSYQKKVGRFMSEYGFQGFPELSTLKKFTVESDLFLGSSVMKSHQKHPAGYETIDAYLMREFNKPKDFESYILASQLLQAGGIQTAIEAHRRAKPYCMGSLFWQLNDCWPVVSWSAIDYYGKKKAVFYRIKNAFSEILPSFTVEKGFVQLYIVSDYLQKKSVELHIKLTDFSGKTYLDKSFQTEIPSNSSTVVFDTLKTDLISGLDSSRIVLSVTLNGLNTSVSRNNFYFAAPKNLALEYPSIKVKTEKIREGYHITLFSDKLAKGVQLSIPVNGEFSDNYFDILPGETRDLIFLTKSEIKNIQKLLKVTTLFDTYINEKHP